MVQQSTSGKDEPKEPTGISAPRLDEYMQELSDDPNCEVLPESGEGFIVGGQSPAQGRR